MDPQPRSVERARRRTSVEHFSEQLRALRTAVGNPSFRTMAKRSGGVSHTTLHEAAAGTRFPSWETTREFIRACGAEEEQWRRRWEEAQLVNSAPVTAHVHDQLTDRGEPTPGAEPHVGDTTSSGTLPQRAAAQGVEAAGSESTSRRQPRLRRGRWLLAGMTALALVMIVAARRDSPAAAPPTMSAAPAASVVSGPLVPGDASKFVADVTIQDGTKVKVNSQFTKVWAIANTGTVGWHNRFLARMDPLDEDDVCRTPNRVPIGDTLPGDQAMISVPVVTVDRPGRCWVGWKMVDESGQPYFPSRRPVFFLVDVTR